MRKLEHIAILDKGAYWAIHGTEEELDEIMRLAKRGSALEAENARLREEIEVRTSDGIHTCHAHCKRYACVLRRENARLKEAIVQLCDCEETSEGGHACRAHEFLGQRND